MEEKTMANTYAETVFDMMEQNSKVVQIEADLAACIWGGSYSEAVQKFPKQYFNAGIQEANMVGVACGLSLKGFVPFVHSFSGFVARRTNDQIFISGCFNKSNIRLVGSDPGVMAEYNGGTHMPFDDIGAIRSFTDITIIEPSDTVQLEDVLRQLADVYGMYYIRLTRNAVQRIYKEGSTFEIGKGNVVIDGDDVTIFATGSIMLGEAIKAAAMLKDKGISARIIDMFTVKPVDRGLIVKCAKETGAIVTAENHSVIGGLGSAVSEGLGEEWPGPVERVGTREVFGEVGSAQYLIEKFGLAAGDIAAAAQRAVSRK